MGHSKIYQPDPSSTPSTPDLPGIHEIWVSGAFRSFRPELSRCYEIWVSRAFPVLSSPVLSSGALLFGVLLTHLNSAPVAATERRRVEAVTEFVVNLIIAHH
jgi:hypothetical protein